MTNLELLALTAKAVGYRILSIQNGKLNVTKDNKKNFHWNPLDDDGDAFRLAVKLGMKVIIDIEAGYSWIKRVEGSTPHGTDPYAATRFAIVRAAAETGKQMQ